MAPPDPMVRDEFATLSRSEQRDERDRKDLARTGKLRKTFFES